MSKELNSDDSGTDSQFHDVLYRYISNEKFVKRYKYSHPDPMFEEYSYGEGYSFAAFVWKNIGPGSRLFFHTTIGGCRYLTAMITVSKMAPAAVWRADSAISAKYKNPHLHPEIYQDWSNWGETNRQEDLSVIKIWEEGDYPLDCDIMILGDPSKSIDIRNEPIVLNKEVLSRLGLLGKPIKWDIFDKNGNAFNESECMNSCLRSPRLLSRGDSDYLRQLVTSKSTSIVSENNLYLSLGSAASAEILSRCYSESDVESFLIKNLGVIDSNLTLIKNQQILKDNNRIDILAKFSNFDHVIIEVKKGTASDDTLTQLLSYLNQYKKENPNFNVTGRIVCQDASYRLKSACEHLGIHIHYYGDILFDQANA